MTSSFTLVANEFPEIIYAFIFLTGACVGSFLNVCIYRIPAGESIVKPPSHCACGAHIKWYLNIPILSWFLLRGRAACCGRHISFRYPLVEASTAALFLCLWILLPHATAVVGMIFVSLMIFCTFVDLDTMTLPDLATAGGALAGFLLACALPETRDAEIAGAPFFASSVAAGVSSITGMVVGAGATYCVRLAGEIAFGREAMGEGDVILVGCIGAFCGWQGALFALFGGAVIGCVILIPVLLIKKLFFEKAGTGKEEVSYEGNAKGDVVSGEVCESDGKMEIPFGPWLAIGGVLYFIFLRAGVDAYFNGIQMLLFSK